MTYEKFMEQVKEQILSYLPEEYANADVMIQEVTKNNDRKFQAMCIKRPADRIVPNIYLEGYYQMHQKGRDMDSILTALARTHQESIKESKKWMSFRADNYESIKDRLYVTVLNRDSNQNYLKDVVHKDIPDTDITAVVRVLCENRKEIGTASFLVKDNMLEMWGISGEALYEQALKNTESLFKPEMFNIRNILFDFDEEETKSKALLPYEQYVLSNDAKMNGATVMLYPNLLQEIGEATGSNFFILPSSIHELILVKDSGEMSAEEFQRMVMEINRTQVEPEEVLSDEVYCYDYEEQKLTMATDPSQTKEFIAQMSGMYEHEETLEEDMEEDYCMEG